jgi:cation transport regulator ChaC
MPFYFAFGSCMSMKDIRRTEPRADFVGAGRVYSMKLAFTRYSHHRGGGVADIIPAEPGDKMQYVEGTVFHVPHFINLDIREGHPTIYRRTPISVRVGREWIQCYTYTVVDKHHDEIDPSDKYIDLILDGARLLSDEYNDLLHDIIFTTYRPPYAPFRRKRLSYDPDLELRKRMGVL